MNTHTIYRTSVERDNLGGRRWLDSERRQYARNSVVFRAEAAAARGSLAENTVLYGYFISEYGFIFHIVVWNLEGKSYTAEQVIRWGILEC
jgi:hypothetical protein